MKSFIANENTERKSGRMKCQNCGSSAGFHIWKYRRKTPWWNKITCADCGSFEKAWTNTGEVFEQAIGRARENRKERPAESEGGDR